MERDKEMTTGSESIYKVTLYMTPCQWDRMSTWSAQYVEDTWMMLIHKGEAQEDYEGERERMRLTDVQMGKTGVKVYETNT